MNDISEEEKIRKKAIFDSMSLRRQKHILKRGYDVWDPFELPKDPIDIRKDKTKRTTHMLIREFLQTRTSEGVSACRRTGTDATRTTSAWSSD